MTRVERVWRGRGGLRLRLGLVGLRLVVASSEGPANRVARVQLGLVGLRLVVASSEGPSSRVARVQLGLVARIAMAVVARVGKTVNCGRWVYICTIAQPSVRDSEQTFKHHAPKHSSHLLALSYL